MVEKKYHHHVYTRIRKHTVVARLMNLYKRCVFIPFGVLQCLHTLPFELPVFCVCVSVCVRVCVFALFELWFIRAAMWPNYSSHLGKCWTQAPNGQEMQIKSHVQLICNLLFHCLYSGSDFFCKFWWGEDERGWEQEIACTVFGYLGISFVFYLYSLSLSLFVPSIICATAMVESYHSLDFLNYKSFIGNSKYFLYYEIRN